MTLPDIDKRLTLFRYYLQYRVANYERQPFYIMTMIFKVGWYPHIHTPIKTFDEWLVDMGFEELVDDGKDRIRAKEIIESLAGKPIYKAHTENGETFIYLDTPKFDI